MSVFVTDAWQSATPVPTTKLITKVARLYGLGRDAETKGLALEWLDEAVRDLNTHHAYQDTPAHPPSSTDPVPNSAKETDQISVSHPDAPSRILD